VICTAEICEAYEEGQDIGHKGGVYGVTLKLQGKHGAHRVIDTLLDEQTILGLGIGLAHNGMVDLGSLQNDSSRVNAVSADGNVIVGWDANPWPSDYYYWRGAVWWQGLERLLNPFGWIGQAEGTNENGSVIVGRGHPSAYRHAYRFTAWDGHFEELGALPRGLTADQSDQEDTSIAYAVSDDGNVVVKAVTHLHP